MAQFVDLRPGQSVTVVQGNGMSGGAYDTAVRQITSEYVELDLPRRDGERMAVYPGDHLTLLAYVGEGLFSFQSRVRELSEVPEQLLTIDVPEAVDKTERRQFYRLDTSIAARYAALTDDDGGELRRLDVSVMDLSGGGMQLRSTQAVDLGSLVRVIFNVGNDPVQVDVSAIVISSQPEERTSRFRVHVRYVELARSQQEQIIRHIFREQVRRLHKGAL